MSSRSTSQSTAEQWKQMVEALQQQNHQLQQQTAELQQQMSQLQQQAAEAAQSGGTTRREKVPKPSNFDGERGNVQAFLTQARAYLFANAHFLLTEADKILFVGGLLVGKAAEWWEPTLRDYVTFPEDKRDDDTKEIFADYVLFEKRLRNTFGNPDEQRTAERQLLGLRQSGSTGRYSIEFQRIAAKLDWNDEALMVQFYKGLREDVKDDLSREPRPDDLAKYIELATKIDNRLYERRQERQGKLTGYKKHTPNSGRRINRSTAYGTHSGPMDLDVYATQSDRKQKVCYNCQKPGHFANKCPQKKKRNWKPVPERKANVITKENGGRTLAMIRKERIPSIQRDSVTRYFDSIRRAASPTTQRLTQDWEHGTQPDDRAEYYGINEEEEDESSYDECASSQPSETTPDPFEGYGEDVSTAEQLLHIFQMELGGLSRTRPLPRDSPLLRPDANGHSMISWFCCVYNLCPVHLWDKLEFKWMPKRPTPHTVIPEALSADRTSNFNLLVKGTNGKAKLHHQPSNSATLTLPPRTKDAFDRFYREDLNEGRDHRIYPTLRFVGGTMTRDSEDYSMLEVVSASRTLMSFRTRTAPLVTNSPPPPKNY